MNLRVRERTSFYEPTRVERSRWLAPLMHAHIEPNTPACCCPAPAVYQVVVAPSVELPSPPEILLCAHHMWSASGRLSQPDIAVYDADGRLVEMLAPPTFSRGT
jgi:hypothetical protein